MIWLSKKYADISNKKQYMLLYVDYKQIVMIYKATVIIVFSLLTKKTNKSHNAVTC